MNLKCFLFISTLLNFCLYSFGREKVSEVVPFNGDTIKNYVVSFASPISVGNPIERVQFVDGIKNDVSVKGVLLEEKVTDILHINKAINVDYIDNDVLIKTESEISSIDNDVLLKPMSSVVHVETLKPLSRINNTEPIKLSNFSIIELYNPAYCSTLYGLAMSTNVSYDVVWKAFRLIEFQEKNSQ